MVKDSVEVLNNMYNKPDGAWTDKLYIKSFKELNADNIIEIKIIMLESCSETHPSFAINFAIAM